VDIMTPERLPILCLVTFLIHNRHFHFICKGMEFFKHKNCNSKKGTADTSAGAFKYGGAKCEGQNGGTVAAGGIKSGSAVIGLHGSQEPSGNSHFGGIIKR
jgi:hypothetical protein